MTVWLSAAHIPFLTNERHAKVGVSKENLREPQKMKREKHISSSRHTGKIMWIMINIEHD